MDNTSVDKFIGSAKVLKSETDAQGMVSYSLDNGLSLVVTTAQFQAMVSDSAYNDAKISIRKWRSVIGSIIALLMEDNAEFQDVGWILDKVVESVAENANRATAKALGIPSREQLSLKKIDEILKAE